MTQYMDRITFIVDKLNRLGFPTADDDVCYKILASIPEKYKPITMACMQVDSDKLSVAYLRGQFALEESRASISLAPNPSKGSKENPITLLNTNSKQKCTRCGAFGHGQHECRSGTKKVLAYQQRQKRKYKKKETNEVSTSQAITFGVFVGEPSGRDDEWYLDSGCTQHMCRSQAYLTNLEKCHITVTGALGTKEVKAEWMGNISLTCQITKEPRCQLP